MAAGPLSRLVGLPDTALTDLIGRLRAADLTVATAESLTGGLLAALLTEVPGASAVVRGGLVVYATELKASLAGVDAELLDQRGPVDPDVALALADGARAVCGAAIGVGLTGVAGPEPQRGVPVGTVFVAVTGPGRPLLTVRRPADLATLPAALSRRDDIRFSAVRAAVELLGGLG
jgi:nicotinamide-nucleotide amidase